MSAGDRIELSRIVDIIQRLWSGKSQANVCRDVGVTTRTVYKYHRMAEAAGWLSSERSCPEAAEIDEKIRAIDSLRVLKYSKPVLTPYKDIIMEWLVMKIPLKKIHELLIEKYDMKVSYSNVQKFCYRLKNDSPEISNSRNKSG